MASFSMHKKDVVPFVLSLLRDFDIGLQWITITRPEKSEGSYVYTVTGMWSGDTVEEKVSNFSSLLTSILEKNTPVG